MNLYLIRHGQTDWNVARRIQGRQDIPLNETGLHQADCLARGMENRRVSQVFSSPQLRARQTAERICKSQSQTPALTLLPELMEISYGSWEGRTSDDILTTDRQLYESWWKHPATVSPPQGESLSQVDERCRRAWDFIRQRLSGDAAIVSHGGTLAHLIVCLLEGGPDAKEIIVGNASITTLAYDPASGRCSLVELNDSRHLGKE